MKLGGGLGLLREIEGEEGRVVGLFKVLCLCVWNFQKAN